jgi:hypothetical protein
MKELKAKSVVATIEMARANSKYNTRKSNVNKKWVRFLKNRKLFDEYMVYLAGEDAIGVEPKSYKELSNICHNISGRRYEVRGGHKPIHVVWTDVFKDFMDETIKWYNIKEIFLYMVNNRYE